MIFLFFCTCIFVLILTFYIWHLIESIRVGYDASSLTLELQELKERVEKLETQKAELLSLERVERIAKEKLNLQKPRKEQIFQFAEKGISDGMNQ